MVIIPCIILFSSTTGSADSFSLMLRTRSSAAPVPFAASWRALSRRFPRAFRFATSCSWEPATPRGPGGVRSRSASRSLSVLFAATRANAEAACYAHIACHASNIALFLGRKVTFDPVKNEFIGDEQANRLRSEALREPWRL